jgi:hypothetical protein
MKISDNMTDYTLDIMDSTTKKSVSQKTFVYYEYFTERGHFLEDRFHKNLSGYLANVKQ